MKKINTNRCLSEYVDFRNLNENHPLKLYNQKYKQDDVYTKHLSKHFYKDNKINKLREMYNILETLPHDNELYNMKLEIISALQIHKS